MQCSVESLEGMQTEVWIGKKMVAFVPKMSTNMDIVDKNDVKKYKIDCAVI